VIPVVVAKSCALGGIQKKSGRKVVVGKPKSGSVLCQSAESCAGQCWGASYHHQQHFIFIIVSIFWVCFFNFYLKKKKSSKDTQHKVTAEGPLGPEPIFAFPSLSPIQPENGE